MAMALSRNLIVTNELGLHARAAAKIVQLAEKAQAPVYVGKDGEEVDATSLLDIIGLYCPKGTEVSVRITDPVDAVLMEQIVVLIEQGFGEQ
jgi:phosphocarrier protein